MASDGRKPTFYLMKMGGTKGGRLSRRFMGIGGGGAAHPINKNLSRKRNREIHKYNTGDGVCVCDENKNSMKFFGGFAT